MSKLKNTLAIQQMLAGEHKLQTRLSVQVPEIGKTKIEIPKLIGSRWIDEYGNEIEQKDGYTVNYGLRGKDLSKDLRDTINSFQNCLEKEQGNECKKNWINIIPQDLKFKAKTQRCMDCQIAFEHKLKISGEYELYEAKKVLENAKSWFKEAEQDKEKIKDSYRNIGFVEDADGGVEKWVDTNLEERLIMIDNEFEKFRTVTLKTLEDNVLLLTK